MTTNITIAAQIAEQLDHDGERLKTEDGDNVTQLCRNAPGEFIWDDDLCVVRWTFVDGSRLVVAMGWWALAEDYDG